MAPLGRMRGVFAPPRSLQLMRYEMLRNSALAILIAALTMSSCADMSRDEQILVGGLAGATVALITAEALDIDDDWVIVTALAGATVGALVARNRATNECAYKWRGNQYRVVRCP